MAKPSRPTNPLALAVLALLFERPMHPYEMAATMKQRHKEESIKLRYGSLYTVIELLLARGRRSVSPLGGYERWIAAQFGVDEDFAAELAALAPLAEQGLVSVAAGRVSVSEAGRPFVRLVAAAFDAYLDRGAKRHSVAV